MEVVCSFLVLSSERRSQRFGAHVSASKAVPEGRAAGDLLRQKTPLERPDPDPQSNTIEHVDRTFSDGLGSRYLFNVYCEINGVDMSCHSIQLSWWSVTAVRF